MMRKVSLLFLVSVMSLCVNAQFRFGVTAGGNLSKLTMKNLMGDDSHFYNASIGIQAGCVAEYAFLPKFGVQAQLTLVQNSSTINSGLFSEVMDELQENGIDEIGGRVTLNQLQLPVYLKASVPITKNGIKLYGMAGGFMAYVMTGKMRMDEKGNGTTSSMEWSLFDLAIHDPGGASQTNVFYMQRFNAGIALELGCEFKRLYWIGLNFKRVLSEMSGYSYGGIVPKTQMNAFSISIGRYL